MFTTKSEGSMETYGASKQSVDAFYQRDHEVNFIDRAYALAPDRVSSGLAAELARLYYDLRESHTVLEIGCGTGRILERIAPLVRSVTGIDFVPFYIRIAAERLAHEQNAILQVADATCLSFENNAFDLVICMQNTLGGMDESAQVQALQEAHRVLSPNGLMIVSSYAECSLEARLEWYAILLQHGLMGRIDAEKSNKHIVVTEDGFASRCFTEDQLKGLFRGVGFTCLSIESVGGLYHYCRLAKGWKAPEALEL